MSEVCEAQEMQSSCSERGRGAPGLTGGPTLTLLTPALTQCNQIQFFLQRERESNIPFHCKSHFTATAELIHHIFNIRSFIQKWTAQSMLLKIISVDKNTTIKKKQVENDESS